MRPGFAAPLVATLLAFLPVGLSSQAASPIVWSKPDRFWFQKSVPGGHIWLNVDATHGVKEPLFDHQRLAIELSLRTGNDYTPLTLPFADPAAQFVVKYDGSNAYIQEGALAIEFILDGHLWRCDLQIKWNWNLVPPTDYECLSRRPATPGAAGAATTASSPVRSPDGRWEAIIQNHNVAIQPTGAAGAAATILTSDGDATNAYQLGSIRWTPDSRGLTVYRVHSQVWLSDGVAGNVKGLVTRSELYREGRGGDPHWD